MRWKVVIVAIVVLITGVVGNWGIAAFTKLPLDPDKNYFRDSLGRIYVDVTTGCLDICFFRSYKRITSADPKTFVVFNGYSYAKDNNYVYWDGEIVPQAKPVFFAVGNSEFFGTDGFNLFYRKDLVNNPGSLNVDFATLRSLSIDHGQYTADTPGFEFFRDKSGIYGLVTQFFSPDTDTGGFPAAMPFIERLDLVDPATLVVDDNKCSGKGCVAYDKNFVYKADTYGIDILETLNKQISVKSYGGGYTQINGKVYFLLQPVDDADPHTFKFLDAVGPAGPYQKYYFGYTVDKNHAYYGRQILPDADLSTFTAFYTPNNAVTEWAFDANHRYLFGQPLSPADKQHNAWFEAAFKDAEKIVPAK